MVDGKSHRRGRLAGVVVALVGAVAMATMALGWANASPDVGQHRLKVLEPYADATETDLDLGAPGISQGDLSTFNFEVYNASGKVQLGYETAQCVVGSVSQDGQSYTFDCSSNFVLTDGSIETWGPVDPSIGASPRKVMTAPLRLANRLFWN